MIATADDFTRKTKYQKRLIVGGKGVSTTVISHCVNILPSAHSPKVTHDGQVMRFGKISVQQHAVSQFRLAVPQLLTEGLMAGVYWLPAEGSAENDSDVVAAVTHEGDPRN